MHLEPEHHPEPPKTGHRWFDFTITICILMVSVTSLIIAYVHSRTLERMADANERLVEANSWPYLSYSTGNLNGNENAINMSVENDGIGPAKVEAVELKWKGVAYRNGIDFLKACCGFDHKQGDGLQFSLLQGRVLRAGERENILYVPRTGANETAWQALNHDRISEDLNIDVCYCSVFDDCWSEDVVALSLKPRPVSQCLTPAVPFTVPK